MEKFNQLTYNVKKLGEKTTSSKMWSLLEHPKHECYFKPQLLSRGAHRVFDKNNLETLNSFFNISLVSIAISSYNLSRSPSGLLDYTLTKFPFLKL